MRDDINGIPFMQANGFEPIYSYEDRSNNRTDKPHDDVKFKNGNFYVWQVSRGKLGLWWQTARLIHGSFRYHYTVETLEKAVEHQKKTDNEYE